MTDDKLYPISLGPPCKEILDMTKSVCKLCRKEYAFKGKTCLLYMYFNSWTWTTKTCYVIRFRISNIMNISKIIFKKIRTLRQKNWQLAFKINYRDVFTSSSKVKIVDVHYTAFNIEVRKWIKLFIITYPNSPMLQKNLKIQYESIRVSSDPNFYRQDEEESQA